MNLIDREPKSAEAQVVASEQAHTSLVVIEEQLAAIISSARNVAVVAEELLREVSTLKDNQESSGKLQHRLNVAPRLLSATEQQLESLLAMLRMA